MPCVLFCCVCCCYALLLGVSVVVFFGSDLGDMGSDNNRYKNFWGFRRANPLLEFGRGFCREVTWDVRGAREGLVVGGSRFWAGRALSSGVGVLGIGREVVMANGVARGRLVSQG